MNLDLFTNYKPAVSTNKKNTPFISSKVGLLGKR